MAQSSTDTRPKAQFSDYLAIARPDHWIKHVMIVPGIVFAWLLAPEDSKIWDDVWRTIIVGFASACLISSANYVINEWLDASFDAQHPKKRSRPAVRTAMDRTIVYAESALLLAAGPGLASLVSQSFLIVSAVFAVAGFLYNVRPFRTKDVPFFMLTRGEDYVDKGQQHYEEQQRQRSIAALRRRAADLGFAITPTAVAA